MTPHKLRVGIDVDDVLLNTLETAWLPEFNELMGLNIKPTDITDWDISKFVPTMYKRAIYDVLGLDSTWDRVQPVRDSRKYLKKLNDNPNVELYIISATSILTTQHKSIKEFNDNAPTYDNGEKKYYLNDIKGVHILHKDERDIFYDFIKNNL